MAEEVAFHERAIFGSFLAVVAVVLVLCGLLLYDCEGDRYNARFGNCMEKGHSPEVCSKAAAR